MKRTNEDYFRNLIEGFKVLKGFASFLFFCGVTFEICNEKDRERETRKRERGYSLKGEERQSEREREKGKKEREIYIYIYGERLEIHREKYGERER